MRFNSYIIDENTKKEKLIKALDEIKKDCRPFISEYIRSGATDFLFRGTKKKIKDFKKIKSREDRLPTDTPLSVQRELDKLFKQYYGIKPRSTGVFTTGKFGEANTYGNAYIFIPAGNYKYIWSPEVRDLYSDFVDSGDYNLYFYEDDIYIDYYDDTYDYDYGEGSGKGVWTCHFRRKHYESIQVDRFEAIQDIVNQIISNTKNYDEKNYDEINDLIYFSIQWNPEIDESDYNQMKYDELRKEQENDIINVIKSYKMKDLKKAIESYNEVTFICKYYYLFSSSLEKMIKDFLIVPQKQLTFRWDKK